jgi:hypothetical protein
MHPVSAMNVNWSITLLVALIRSVWMGSILTPTRCLTSSRDLPSSVRIWSGESQSIGCGNDSDFDTLTFARVELLPNRTDK